MTAADFAPLIQAIIALLAAIITGMIGIWVPRAIAAFEARTHVALTQQQRDAVRQAALTQAGIIETSLQQGVLKLSQVRENSPEMLAAANAALSRVPESAAAVGISKAAMASVITGATDTAKVAPPH